MSRFSLVRGRVLRLTKTDGCGQPLLGPRSTLVTDGFISVGMTPTNVEGEAISVTNANGENCVLDTPSPRFQNFAVTVNLCGVDPEALSMLTGQPVRFNAAGTEVVGFTVNSRVDLGALGFALELWSKVPVAACDASGLTEHGYFGLPFLQGGTLGDVTVENAAVNFSVTGAVTKDGNGWGAGPYDVVRDEVGLPGPLNDPLDPYDHFILERTTVPPPSPTTGAIALGTAATGATAGSPGAATPANSYFPETLASMSTVTATPSTAWTSGQYVSLADGSTAHWNGTAWVAGPAS